MLDLLLTATYPKYKYSGVEWIGDVPEGWEVKKLKYCFSFHTGWTPPTTNSDYFIGNNTWITIADMKAKYLDDSVQKLSDEALNELRIKITKKGSLLYSFKLSVGKIAFAGKDLYTNEAILSISPMEKHDLQYYYYALPECLIINANENIYGAKILNQDLIKNSFLIVPSNPHNNFIHAYLNRKTAQIDNLISKKQKLIELLKEERAAIINQAVTKGLNPDLPMKDSGIEWIGEAPEHWEVKRLKWLIKGKLKYGANEATELTDESLPRYIRITDFDDNGTLRIETFKSLPFEIAKDYLLHDGDILFARSGATVGKTFLYQNYKGIACYAGYLIKASVNSELILSNFLYYYTKSSTYENWKDSVFIQATIQNIGADKYQMLNVPRPPLNEQVRIIKHIDKETTKIDQVTSKIEKQINFLQEYRTALISEVVTGKIDVRDGGSNG